MQLQAISNIPQEVLDLVEEREGYRKNKRFSKSDEIRAKIERLGYVIKDSKDETKILRKIQ